MDRERVYMTARGWHTKRYLVWLFRIIVSFGIALLTSFILGLIYSLPGVFDGFILFSTFFAVLILWQLFYSRKYRVYFLTVSFVMWLTLLYFVIPIVAEREFRRIADDQVPIYPGAQFVETLYSPPHGVQRAVVVFKYTSTNPDEEFPKLIDFFQNQLGQSQWEFNNLVHEGEKIPGSYEEVSFIPKKEMASDYSWSGLFEGKVVEVLPTIYLVRDSTKNTLLVRAHF